LGLAVPGDQIVDGADQSDPAGERARFATGEAHVADWGRTVEAQFEEEAVGRVHGET
jgi:ssDNA-binding replication factor A large subunit